MRIIIDNADQKDFNELAKLAREGKIHTFCMTDGKECFDDQTIGPRIEYGTDGQPYKLSITNGKECERTKSEWITNKEYIDKRYNGHYDGSCFNSPYNCSHCGYSPKDDRPNYCPDCGADMRKVERGIFNESKM